MTNRKQSVLERRSMCVTLDIQRITPQLERTKLCVTLVSQTSDLLLTFNLYLGEEQNWCSWFGFGFLNRCINCTCPGLIQQGTPLFFFFPRSCASPISQVPFPALPCLLQLCLLLSLFSFLRVDLHFILFIQKSEVNKGNLTSYIVQFRMLFSVDVHYRE